MTDKNFNPKKKFFEFNETFRISPNKFLPALVLKFPLKSKLGFIESVPTAIYLEGNKLIYEKFKYTKKYFHDFKISKEKYKIDLKDKIIFYTEKGINSKENHHEESEYILNDPNTVVYNKKLFNNKFEVFYKLSNFFGKKRMNELIEKFDKDNSEIENMINFDFKY